MSRTLAPCGTTGAYQRHLKAGEDPCAPCTEARCAEMRQYRKGVAADPVRDDQRRADAAARSRARSRLTAEYPARYAALYVEELARGAAT